MNKYKLIRATIAIALLGALVFGADVLASDPDGLAQAKSVGKAPLCLHR